MKAAVIDTAVTGLGLELVEVEHLPRGLLRVTIDHADGAAVTVEDCERVTRQLQYVLEVEGVDYGRLEVSSPGLDRLLRKPQDFVRFAGAEVDVALRLPFQGSKRYRGVLQERVEGDPEDRFSIVLSPPAARAGPGRSTAAARRKAKAAPPVRADGDVAAADAESVQSVLNFSLAEVREVRLVPVVDFGSGRK